MADVDPYTDPPSDRVQGDPAKPSVADPLAEPTVVPIRPSGMTKDPPCNKSGAAGLSLADLIDRGAVQVMIEYAWHVILLAFILGGFHLVHAVVAWKYPGDPKVFGVATLSDVMFHADVLLFLSVLVIGGMKVIWKYIWSHG